MIKQFFCLILVMLTANISFYGCATSGNFVVQNQLEGYLPENIEFIGKDINTKNLKTPITVHNKEIVIHINQGPCAGMVGGFLKQEGLVLYQYKGVELGIGNKDQQIDLLIKTKKNEFGDEKIIFEDYSKVMAAVLEKQLGRYFSKVLVIDNDPKSTYKGINIKSLMNLEVGKGPGPTEKATVTVTAALTGGAQISTTGTYQIQHLNEMAFLPCWCLFPIGPLIGMAIINSSRTRNSAGVVILAMNDACEKLAPQLAKRIAEMKENNINIYMANY